MKPKLWNTRQKDATGLLFGVLIGLCVLLRLVLAAQGRLYLEPENAPIDDQLMYNAARSITQGNWLGEYGAFTMAKHMFFSVWLAGIHALGLSYLTANAALYCLGAWVMASALRPLLKKRIWVWTAFAVLVFNPVSFDRFHYRVYRDSITVALLLLAFGGIIGLVLRLPGMSTDGADHIEGKAGAANADAAAGSRQVVPFAKGSRGTCWLFAVAGGLGLGASYLNREDGVWLLPFAVCFVLAGVLWLIKIKALKKSIASLVALALPFVLMAGCIAAYAGMNQRFYGRFVVSDFTSSDFTDAYGALAGIDADDWAVRRPVSKSTREILYANSEFFAALRDYWESPQLLNGYGSRATGEYGGSFYFAMRAANALAGHYTSAADAEQFYKDMYAELQRLQQAGVITIGHKTSSTVPFWRAEYLSPLLAEMGNSVKMVLLYESVDVRPQFSVYTKDYLVAEMLDYLHGDIVRGYVAGTDTPYYNLLQQAAFLFEDVLTWGYRVVGLVLALAGMWYLVRLTGPAMRFLFGKKRTLQPEFLIWVLLVGLLLCIVLRCGIMAYMEVTCFGIGTYIMYLSTVTPLYLVFGLLGAAGTGPWLKTHICAPKTLRKEK